MSAVWFEIVGILLLIMLVGYFSACEVAILSTRKSKMKELADDGNRKAAGVLGFQENPEEFLATVHVGIIFSLILASGLAGMIGFQHLSPALSESSIPWVQRGNDYISLGVIVVSVGFLVVVFGELVPKSLSLHYATVVALAVAPSMRFFAVLFRIPARILVFASNLILSMFRDQNVKSNGYSLSEREKEILGQLVEGLSKKQIAEKIFLSHHTVDSHLRNIYAKLEVHSRSSAISKAIREKLL